MFDDELRQRLMRKHGKQLPADRPEHWELATSPQRATQREWMNKVFARMDADARQRLFANLCDSGRFVQSLNEAAVASILLDVFARVEYEPALNGQTPDLVVRSDDGGVRLIIEVVNRLLPEVELGIAKRWEQLRGRVQR